MGFDFSVVLAFALVAVLFALGGITASRVIAPRVPSAEKSSIYECGERPVGVAWFNFNPRFYLVALVFVIFEVDIALTFPVVAVYRRWVEYSPSNHQATRETTVARSRRNVSTSRNCARKRRQAGTGGREGSSLRPSRSSRLCASMEERPRLASLPSAASTSPAD